MDLLDMTPVNAEENIEGGDVDTTTPGYDHNCSQLLQNDGNGNEDDNQQAEGVTDPSSSDAVHNSKAGADSLSREGSSQSGSWPRELYVRRPASAMVAFLQAANATVSAENMHDVTPSFSDALEWVKEHKSDLNNAFRLVHLYPNLIHAECLDGLWDFLLPFIQKGTGLKVPTVEEQHLALHGGSEHEKEVSDSLNDKLQQQHLQSSWLTGGRNGTPRLLYLSANAIAQGESSSSFTKGDLRDVVMRLSETCFVQCSPRHMSDIHKHQHQPHQYQHHQHQDHQHQQQQQQQQPNRAIQHSQVLLFLIDEHSLTDDICIGELEEAYKLSIPVVMLQKKDFSLPTNFPPRIVHTRIQRSPMSKKQQTTVTVSSIRSNVMQKTDSQYLSPSPNPANVDITVPIYRNVNNTSGITLQKSSTEEDASELTLEELVQKAMVKPAIYDVSNNNKASCYETLHARLKPYLGKQLHGGIKRKNHSDSRKKRLHSKEEHLLSSIGFIIPKDGLYGRSSSPHNKGGQCSLSSGRAISVHSAPEYPSSGTLPPLTPSGSQHVRSQSQYLLPHPPHTPLSAAGVGGGGSGGKPSSPSTTQLNSHPLLPSISLPQQIGMMPLRKHRSHESLTPRPCTSSQHLDFSTDRRTNYLVLRTPGLGAEIVPWPPQPTTEALNNKSSPPERTEPRSVTSDEYYSTGDSGELFSLCDDSESEGSFSNALSSVDINLRSLSVTPDLV